MDVPSPAAMDTGDGAMSSPPPITSDHDNAMEVRSPQNTPAPDPPPTSEPFTQAVSLQQQLTPEGLKAGQNNQLLALNLDSSGTGVPNLMGQLLAGTSLNNSLNGTSSLLQLPNGNIQLLNTNPGIALSTENPNMPSTSFIIQHPNQTLAPTLPSQSVLFNPGAPLGPSTFIINSAVPNQPQTFLINPLGSNTQPNGTQPNTAFLVTPGLAGGNPTLLTNLLNSSSVQNPLDSSGNNTTVLIAPPNFTDPNTLVIGPTLQNIAPSSQPPTIAAGSQIPSTAPTHSTTTTASQAALSIPSTSAKVSGKSQSQKTIQELLNEDEQKRVQVDEKSLAEGLKENRDALALRLKLRRPREELISQGIMPSFKSTPAFHQQLQKLERAKVGDHLQKKMRMRPDKKQLVHQHILEDTNVDPLVNATQQRLKRARLEQDLDSKIKNRPGPLELIEGNILKADNVVEKIIKDGKVQFMKTNSSTDRPNPSPYSFYEETSDEALSPPQPETASIDSRSSSMTNIPSPPDFQQYLETYKTHNNSKHFSTTSTCSTNQTPSAASLKPEPELVMSPSYQTIVSGAPSYSHPSPNLIPSSSSSNSRSNISNRQRKKQAKRSKPKEIKFHEYKPPNEQGSKTSSQTSSGNPYNLLLMQQQLFLQLQLLQQQQQMMTPSNQSLSSAPATSVVTHSTAATNVANTPAINTSQMQQPQAAITASTTTSPAQPERSATNVSTSSTPSTSTATKAFCLANLDDMKVSELKAELKSRGLHVSGTKPQLVERLRHAELMVQAKKASSPDVSSTGIIHSNPSRVSSSTDNSLDALSDTNSNRPSLSTPPISPEFQPLSVTSEPMSPGSAFDPISPPTFQPSKPPPSVSSQHSTHTSLSSCQTPDSMRPSEDLNPSLGLQLQSPRSVGPSGDSAVQEMMDMSDFNLSDMHVSSELLIQQQKKIEELQRALQLSQMQLQQQQTQFVNKQFYNPPPPPPPPQPPHASPKMARSMQPTVMRTLTNTFPPPPPPISSPHFVTNTFKANPVVATKADFQGHDFSYAVNHQPKKFTFGSPPPNGQPFQFKHRLSDIKAVPSLQNGVMTAKSNSLPSSPTENPILELGAGLARSITNPNFMLPPPNYEDAVRQNKERKAHLMTSPLPMHPDTTVAPIQQTLTSPSTSTANNNQVSIDDLLEVLAEHGYQIPASDPSSSKETEQMAPPYTMNSISSTYPMQNTIAQMNSITDSSIQQPHTPSARRTPLPMDVDNTGLELSPLNIHSVSSPRENVSSDHLHSPKIKYEVPQMQVDSTDSESNMMSLTMESGSPAENAFSAALINDSDLSWIDLVLPSSASSGVSTPTAGSSSRVNQEGALNNALQKDPFSLHLGDFQDVGTPSDLNHFDADMWENIAVFDNT